MQAVLCDVCGRPIKGQALEVHHIRGEAVHTEEGRPRVVQRGTANMFYMCDPCGGWVTQAIEHLRDSLAISASANGSPG
jgi:hypothetical protein